MAENSVFGEGKRSLICYFSRTGLTKRVVDIVHSKLNSDLFELKAEANYSGLTGYMRSMVHAVWGSGQKIEEFPNFAEFDFIFLAAPVWALTVAAPAWAFIEAADFGDKTVISLPTYGGQLGNFNEAIQGKIKCGKFIPKDPFLNVQKDSDEVLTDKVTAWLEGL
jgi:flavodoxin